MVVFNNFFVLCILKLIKVINSNFRYFYILQLVGKRVSYYYYYVYFFEVYVVFFCFF